MQIPLGRGSIAGLRTAATEAVYRWPSRAVEFSHTRRARRIGYGLAAFLIVYGLVGFVGAPLILRHVLTTQVAASLKRPVAVGTIRFNPFRLGLDIDQLRIDDRAAGPPLADIGHIHVKASWMSLFRMAAVVAEVSIARPRLSIVRTAPQTFNFSDLLAPAPGAHPKPKTASGKPFRFAVSNIQVSDGDVRFDDSVVGATHEVAHIQIGVPFIASLPRDVDIYVQPLLAMVVDGSPLRIGGQTKPLSASRDTVLTLNLHALDLHRYVGYVPVKLPLAVPHGNFSCQLQIHFVQKEPAPVIAIAGRMSLDRVQVNDSAGESLLALGHLLVALNDIEPLGGIFKVGEIRFDRLAPTLVMNADGTTNLTALMAAMGHREAPVAQPTATAPAGSIVTAAPPTGAPSAAPTSAAAPLEATLDSLRIEDSSIHVIDRANPTPAELRLAKLHLLVQNFSLNGRWAAPFEMSSELASGGRLSLKGSLEMAKHKANTDIAVDAIDLPALQGFAGDAVAAKLASGKFDAKATVHASFAPEALDVHVEPANAAVSDLAFAAPSGKEQPLQWSKFRVKVAQVDLASRTARVSEVRGDGIKIFVRRERGGNLNLMTMLHPPARAASVRTARTEPANIVSRQASATQGTTAPTSAKSAPWTFSVDSVVIDKAEVRAEDDAAPHPVSEQIAPLSLHVTKVSSDFSKPIGVEADATIGSHGSFKATGTAALSPLRANIKLAMRRVDLSPADAYLTPNLNAKIASLLLSIRGTVSAKQTRAGIRAGYRGDLALANLRVLDRLTNQDFLRWGSCRLSSLDASGGAGKPKVKLGEVALNNFGAGIILTAEGKLNLKDITARPGKAPAPAPAGEATLQVQSTPAASATPAQPVAAASPAPLPADIDIGAVSLSGGNIDYSDYFIKPNYSANLNQIEGSVGRFGTASAQPAPVELRGDINGSAPLSITGSINPLAPMAFVDLAVNARAVELTGFSPYTTKYTGYPIDNGTLTADVHYLLDQGQLKAENHIVIDRLTFGDKVQNSTAINLPVRLAVAILKARNGVIDLNVPISGSLSDPQFSIGSLVAGAFWNVIVKAATSPFALIGAALGSKEDLSQVTFAPGYALLTTADNQKLDTVVKALEQRTNLKLNIQGCVDPGTDKEALRGAMMDLAVRQQKLKATGGSGDPWEVTVAPDEYDKYLRRAYAAADFPKPRNFLGVAKLVPSDEMKKLMLANTKVTDSDLGKLADARANAVAKYLAAKIDRSRISIKPPNLDAGAAKDGGQPARALLTLE